MKKRLAIIIYPAIIIFILILMAVLIYWSVDTEHAVATVITSTGNYCMTTSENSFREAGKKAVWVVNNEEENVSVYFYCPSCKYEETWEASTLSPKDRIFVCECTGANGVIGQPEYFCVIVTTGEKYFGILEKD